MMDIRQSSVAEITGNINYDYVIWCYTEEATMPGLPRAKADLETYSKLEKFGAIKIFGAFHGDLLIGLAVVLTGALPHYSEKVAVVESLFVLKEFRNTGTGTRLIGAVKKCAKELEAKGILFSARIGSELASLMEANKHAVETNRVFLVML